MADMANVIKEDSGKRKDVTYVIVNNIPKVYRSADLRNFFSEFIETSGFDCFHFRHRPEVQRKNQECKLDGHNASSESTCSSQKGTTCCVIRIYTNRVNDFLRMYNKKHWVGRDGQSLSTRCFVKKVRVKASSDVPEPRFLTRREQKVAADKRDVISETDLKALIELRPPPGMPNGNVGTPTKVFLCLIQACKFPPYLIKKLGLEFPRSRAKGLYGSVPFDYGDTRPRKREVHLDEHGDIFSNAASRDQVLVRTATGAVISEVPNTALRDDVGKNDASISSLDHEGRQNRFAQDDEESDDENCEEWDRHEALHNDVTSQERTRERLFEEELEVQWEKGGSGLVFYTDAQFWDEIEGDFDAKTTDDWDVDMSIYYNPGSGDKDARDYASMLHYKKLRESSEPMEDENRLGSFEQHTKGFGSRMLKHHGWVEGVGREGVVEPFEEPGQHPRDRSGFGFRGEKLVRYFPKKKRRRYKRGNSDVLISTVYDDPRDTDPPEPLLRSHESTYLTFRKPFVKQEDPA